MCWALCRELYIASRGILAGEADAESDAGVKWGGVVLGSTTGKETGRKQGRIEGQSPHRKLWSLNRPPEWPEDKGTVFILLH